MASTASKGITGITFSGEKFIVPETRDVLETLFDPSIRKSNFELGVLLALVSNCLVFVFLKSGQARINFFVALYFFWRLSYNLGIGYLLRSQSQSNKLVRWFADNKIFSGNSLKDRIVQSEIKSQRGELYKISDYPIEFNTWLIFRKIVDLILMLDFAAFFCLVIACSIKDNYQFIHGQATWFVVARLVIGSVLIIFNFWVKENAHSIIKDYAWYWGDFFFRQINNEELIFDGVFEMVPHPMYSVGYIGYYGFAIIAKSFTVLSVAIFGHVSQMIFLHYIENPHIDRIYGPSKSEINWQKLLKLKDLKVFNNVKPLVGLYNFSILRSTDILNLTLSVTYAFVIPFFAANSNLKKLEVFGFEVNYLFILTATIKIFESLLINIALSLQSKYKVFTKWYLSVDAPVDLTLQNWSVFYNSMINISYSSLFGLQVYNLLSGDSSILFSDWINLRRLVAVLLITTQIWINSSIIDLLGYFGWFYGDFFIPKSQRPMNHLTKAGVYRYLNNPEQVFGVCGVMGVFVISPTVENLICCSLWVLNNFVRINFVEKAHMIKIYGELEVSQDSGVTKTFKKHLIPEAIQRRLSESENNDAAKAIRRKSSVTDSLESFIRDLRASRSKLTRQQMIELANNLTFEDSSYNVKINNLSHSRETDDDNVFPNITTVGTPISVSWTGPKEKHSSSDWIGLYRFVQTSVSKTKTLISSHGRWEWCSDHEGTFVFSGKKLFWEEGIYEFRYHKNGGHDVAFVSEPFQISYEKLIVPIDSNELDDFAQELKTKIFDKVLQIDSIDDSIAASARESENVLETLNLLSTIITKATDIKVTSKILLNDKDTSPLTIKKLSAKLLDVKKVLEELSSDHTKKDV